MTKRLFQILDEMNISDGENNTRTVAVSNNLVEAKKVKQGGLVTVGVDAKSVEDLCFSQFGGSKFQAVLLVIDMDAYNKIAK